MSRIYFHSEDGDSEVSGAERAMMGDLCSTWMVDVLRIERYASTTWLRTVSDLLPGGPGRFTHPDRAYWAETLATHLRVTDPQITVGDQSINLFALGLNTAYVLGSDPVKLCARLHGQCELHCYVEGPHRAWLADIMEAGRAINLLRADMGWEATIALLRARDDGPVVCSYSVCEGFPNAGIVVDAGLWTWPVDADGERDWDAWYRLDADERWRLGLAALRAEPNRGLEIRPDTWDTFTFRSGLTALDVVQRLTAEMKD